MLKTYERIKNLKKDKYKSPKTIQDIIPFDFLYKDGTFQKEIIVEEIKNNPNQTGMGC